jgi:nifR3 family TIM-barrel protein
VGIVEWQGMPFIGPFELRNPFVLAPMAGVSEQPFRVLAFRMGAALCPTELVSAQGLMRANARTVRYLRHDANIEQPYSLQIFGGEPEVMAEAARIGQEWGAQIIDINMGCPVKKVTRNGAGSALLCDPPRAARMVRLIREVTGLPVTCKIRSGWDAQQKNYLSMAEHLEDAGCAALAVHPRTRSQGYSGSADWSVIADLKAHVGRMPIIGNGDVKSPADAQRMLETTGCDFVMIGRGALGNPWIFRELTGGDAPSPEERCALVQEHFRDHVEFVGTRWLPCAVSASIWLGMHMVFAVLRFSGARSTRSLRRRRWGRPWPLSSGGRNRTSPRNWISPRSTTEQRSADRLAGLRPVPITPQLRAAPRARVRASP